MITKLKNVFGLKEKVLEPVVHVIEVPPLLRSGEYSDVIAIRHPVNVFKRFTNIPWVLGYNIDKGEGYEWGYGGGGPSDFAINILMHFTDHDEAVSRAYYLEFREEFLENMLFAGGSIEKEKIFSFIERMKVDKPIICELLSMLNGNPVRFINRPN